MKKLTKSNKQTDTSFTTDSLYQEMKTMKIQSKFNLMTKMTQNQAGHFNGQ